MITLLALEGALDLQSSSGNIRGSTIALSADSSVRSESGDIELGISSPSSELRYRLSSDSGDVVLDELKADSSLEYGSGETTFTVTTESGDIRIR